MTPAKPCGEYCKNLPPSTQKDIIFKNCFSIATPIYSNSNNYDRVVPAKWWKEWCDYVNIEFRTLRDHFEQVSKGVGMVGVK